MRDIYLGSLCDCCEREFSQQYFDEGGDVHELVNTDAICDTCFNDHTMECERCEGHTYTNDLRRTECGDDICEDCVENYTITCASCGDIVYTDNAITSESGDRYCESCYDEIFIECADCGDEVDRDDAYSDDHDYYCSHCYHERYATCDCCGSRIYRDEAYFDPWGDSLCESCFHDEYTECYQCGRTIRQEDSYVDEDGNYYCQNCEGSYANTRSINNYSYKPRPVFFGDNDNEKYFGIELEIEGAGRDSVNARELIEIINEGYRFNEVVYVKYDGSVDTGFEFVTHPLSYEFALNMPWKKMFKRAIEMGYRGHDRGNCGLHIHISRKAFGDDHESQDDGIMNVLYIVEKFWDEMVKFSRRTQGQLERWASRYGLFPPRTLLEKAKYSARYRAVNLNNTHTIELRFFRGTLKYNTFIATLQFVNHIVNVAIEKDIEDIQQMSWNEFIEYNDFVFNHDEFRTYLEERGMWEERGVVEQLELDIVS